MVKLELLLLILQLRNKALASNFICKAQMPGNAYLCHNLFSLYDTEPPPEAFKLYPIQIATAMKILSQVCAIADSDQMALDLGRFIKVDILIIVPPAPMLYHQTVQRLMHSGKG